MFRLIRWLIFLIVVLCLLAGIIVWLSRISVVESILSQKLDTDVTVEDVSLGWNQVTLKNLRLKNLPQSKVPYAFEAQSVTIQMSPFELGKKEIHVQRIKIQDPHLTVELYNSAGNDNNWASILKRIPSPQTVTAAPSELSHFYIIDRLSITNLQIDLLTDNKTTSLPKIPYLELHDVGRNHTLTLAQLCQQLFVAILEAVQSKYHLGALLEHFSSKESLDQSARSAKHSMKEGMETLKRKAEEAKEYLQHLFSK